MRRYVLWFLALGLVAWLSELQGWLVEAASSLAAGGTAMDIGGVNDFADTIDSYARGPIGKIVGMCMAMGGIAAGALGRYGLAAGGIGTGVTIAFVPNIVDTAFDQSAGSPLVAATAVPSMALAGEGVVLLLKQVGVVLLWPLSLAFKLVRDPVVWVAFTLALSTASRRSIPNLRLACSGRVVHVG